MLEADPFFGRKIFPVQEIKVSTNQSLCFRLLLTSNQIISFGNACKLLGKKYVEAGGPGEGRRKGRVSPRVRLSEREAVHQQLENNSAPRAAVGERLYDGRATVHHHERPSETHILSFLKTPDE